MKVIKNLDEFFARCCNEFINAGFEEYYRYNDNSIEYHLNDEVAIVGLHNDSVQIYLNSFHEWSSFIFPCRCLMSILGNSIFYYGEIVDYDE